MNLLKKILFPVFSLFLTYRSIDLMRDIMGSKVEEYSHFEIIVISFLLSVFITGIFAIVGFTYKTSNILPDNYYEIKKPGSLNLLYRLLGVKYFRVLLLTFYWGWKKNRVKYFNGTKAGLQNFIFQTKQSEFGHLVALIALFVSSIILLYYRHFSIVIGVTIFNIAGNLYPIILQRKHRMRIQKITNRL